MFSQPFQEREVKGSFWEIREVLERLFWKLKSELCVRERRKGKEPKEEEKENSKRRFQDPSNHKVRGVLTLLMGIIIRYVVGSG